MNMWAVEYLKEAIEDLGKLDRSQQLQVIKAINKVASNPLPHTEGGFGKPLGSRIRVTLTGYCKIKLRKLGIRVVYKAVKEDKVMRVVVISSRDDGEAYIIAQRRTD